MTAAQLIFDVQCRRRSFVARIGRWIGALTVGTLSEGAFEVQFRVLSVRAVRRSDGEVLLDEVLPQSEADRLLEDWQHLSEDAFVERWGRDDFPVPGPSL